MSPRACDVSKRRASLNGLLGATLAGIALAGPVAAQDWITPEACAVSAGAMASARLPDAFAAEAEARAKVIANGTGRLWRVTAPGGQISHLWGTFHSSDPLIARPAPELGQLIDKASVLLLENDPRAKSRTELQERALQFSIWLAPEHMPYEKTYLTGPVVDWARARAEAVFQDPDAFPALTDAGLAFYLFSDPCEDFTTGILPMQDHRLMLAAVEAGVPVKGLESWDAVVNDLGDPERSDMVKAIVQEQASYLNPEGFTEARRAAFRLYDEGQIGLMMTWDLLYLEQMFGAEEAARLATLADGYLLGERNQRFLRQMQPHLEAGGALVAVGAFHLPGAGGLVEGLRSAGFKVERVPLPGEAP